jgi:cytochrome c oxidase cbb3-type subunit 4
MPASAGTAISQEKNVDINDLRGLATILCMLAFVSIVVWAYSSSRRKDFEEAAMLPFSDRDAGGSEVEKTE